MEQRVKPVVVLGPMISESSYLGSRLGAPTPHEFGTCRFISGVIGDIPVVVGRTFIGMVNSALCTAVAIDRFDPQCVIIQGTAGAHDPALHQGDIILGENIVELGSYYTSHRNPGEGSCFGDWTRPGAEIVGNDGDMHRVCVLHSDPAILDLAAEIPYEGGIVRRGTIGAADIWNRELDMIAHLRETLGTDCEEMEGFAVAQVCARMGVPCADIRIISNSEWHSSEEFDSAYGRQCQEFCLTLIRRWAEKR